jgi:hypothetical protein
MSNRSLTSIFFCVAFSPDLDSRAFRAPIVHDVDHDLGFMVGAMRRDIRIWIAERW